MDPERTGSGPVDLIVLGMDGSDGSFQACGWTAKLAAQIGASVVVVRGYDPLSELGNVEPPVDLPALERRAAQQVEVEWASPLVAAGVPVSSRLVEDDAVHAIATVARELDADLVVVGSHGRTGWRERILGRVASRLPHAVDCPVLIVPQIPREPR